MIKFNINVDDRQIITSFFIEGHACYDIKGKDIVCSAVSTLIAGFILSIDSLDSIKFEQESLNPGCLSYKLLAIDKKEEVEIASYSNFLLNSLLWLEKDYKDYCEVNIKNTGAR